MPSEKKRRRRGLQFSLRALLVLITAFGVWLGIRVDHVRRQRNLAAAMEGVNGQPVYDWWLGGASGPPGPDWLRSWLGDEYFQDLAGVMLDNNPTLTDAELLRLAVPMKDANVRILNLQMLGRRSPITDVGLARIGEVRTLETLTLQGTNITD
ncbi:MAG TPA: hypothetical protein VHB99_11845, partial [Pirellulales bacterium]|nr:hypothetical protein [Pirellulales bacterium]